jgi:hypothetical protein
MVDSSAEFAMMKLAAQKHGKHTWESFLAAISVRLMLDFEPRGISAFENENLMVAGHLRVANVIPSHLCGNVRSSLIEKVNR